MSTVAEVWVAVRADVSKTGADIQRGLGGIDTSKAGKNAGEGFASAFSGTIHRLGSTIGGEVGEIVSKVGAAFETVGESHDRVQKRMAIAGGITAGAGVALMGVASSAVEAQNQLEAAVTATGKGYADFGDEVDSLVGKQVEFGNTDATVKDSLRVLTQAYGDPKKALEQMGLVTDLAAAKHIGLSEAATMVAKAHGGAGRVFKEFGITVGQTADGTKDYEGALAVLSGKLTGQASAAQDSFAGKVRAGKAWLEDAAATLGEKYGPAITAAGVALTVLASLADSAAVKIIAHRVAMAAAAIASGVMTAAQWLLNAALTANPIGIVIVALVALAAGFVWAYTHSQTFRDIVDGVWQAIQTGAQFMWNNILHPMFDGLVRAFQATWEGAQTFGRILSEVWAALKEAAAAPIRFVVNTVFSGVVDAFNTVSDFVHGPHITKPTVGFAGGGTVLGSSPNDRADNIPARLTAGEYILPVAATNALRLAGGEQLLENLRHGFISGQPYADGGLVRGYADGGLVGWLQNAASNVADTVSNVAAFFTNPVDALMGVIDSLVSGAVSNPIAQLGVGLVRKVTSSMVDSIKGLFNPDTGGGGSGLVGSGAAGQALAFARAQIGKPYIWGATGPNAFDCSGLMQAAWRSAGYQLTRTTYSMLAQGGLQAVNEGQLQLGDLIFPNTGHVQMFSGNGHVVEAANPRVPIREAGMSGFMTGRHIPTFDNGGILGSGLNLINNATGHPENLVRADQQPITINVAGSVISERDLVRVVRDGLVRLGRRGDPLPA